MFIIDRFRVWWLNLASGWRTVLSLIALAVFSTVMFLLIYVIFFKRPAATQPSSSFDDEPVQLGDFPVSGQGVDRKSQPEELPVLDEVSDIEAVSPVAEGGRTLTTAVTKDEVLFVSNSKGLRYYDSEEGLFYRLDKDGRPRLLSQKKFPQVEKATWSPVADEAILEFPDGSNVYYDFKKKRQVTLPLQAEGFGFSQGGTKLAYKMVTNNSKDNWLYLAKPDGTQARPTEHLGDNHRGVKVNFSPDGQVVGTYTRSVSSENQMITFLGQNNENFLGLEVNGRGFQGQWSPRGKRLLYSIHNSGTIYRPQLWVANAEIESIGRRNNTAINVRTWAEKCVFSKLKSHFAYCAVPVHIPDNAGTFPEISRGIPDEFYRVNLKTGLKTLLAQPVDNLGIDMFAAEFNSVSLSEDESSLYFVDQIMGSLQEIKLP